MMTARPESWHAALHRLQRDGRPHALVTQVTSAGSTPREPGARMVITEDAVYDTLGGGTFEWQTIAAARQRLAASEPGMTLEAFSLGGRSGQCCGGFVNVLIEVFPGSRTTLALFGAGHVGQELVRLAAPLPWRVLWHDSRDDAFPAWAADQPRLACRASPDPEAAVAALPAGVHALVLTHDHAEDRALVDALLARGDTASLGLIGSKSKWASFRSRLSDAGHGDEALATVRCPVGQSGGDKTPYAIALAALAELLPLVETPERGDQRGLDPADLRRVLT
ncbi:xanthine dehydrogenase accessory protein XdhC [Halomonas heilongjiangensis]|uniref:Xanthine dehydrogenase accessory protein XdhC n=1 Tax=Halomonas heilongjiangensis TaxID=1387883 RepID=A0A2N7TNR1_9GAMM|nr:xanthine dehydrogenase accessory protein XdhC [Halomonas heilongjiangensis]PMR69841.1 xanthine dehydrogenase accessory protein XdhC [Halomonas heilongjiangensis]PXX90531.1 xanthine dehydrogenase accessory protein XdhC [Halomonas heilongjiangensis]